MESWVVGYAGDEDVERHAAIDSPLPRTGEGPGVRALPRLRIRAISDYICPWCYIGLVRIERLREEFDVDFEVGAYELRPGIPPEGISRKEASAGRVYPPGYLDNLIQTARDAGIDMKRPPLVPNTRKAHEATEFAKEAGALLPFHRALFAAYFEREENIGDTDVICRIGAECGLDAGTLERALNEGRYAAAVEEQLVWARAAAITGVPTFIFDEKFALTGAQDYEVFRDVARRLIDRRSQAEG
jgi:predicted DsbA family dithiol-disulfide isomerase